MAATGVQWKQIMVTPKKTIIQDTTITLYWTTVRPKNRKGMEKNKEMLHTSASDFRVHLPNSLDSSDPPRVPAMPAITVTPPNNMAAL